MTPRPTLSSITARGHRRVLTAAPVVLLLAATTASAQNVVVRDGPPGMKLEVVLNATPVGSATFDQQGEATVPLNLRENAGKAELDAAVEVDYCSDLRRVVIVERGQPGFLPQPGCDRQPISGLYFVRRPTTMIVRVGGPGPTLMLLQRTPGSRTWNPAPSGLMVFGGGGLAKFNDAAIIACGAQSTCSGRGYKAAYTAGVEFWPLRFLGAEAAFVRPAEIAISGNGTGYRFTNRLDAHMITMSGKVGLPLASVRLYGRAGANYHRTTSTTEQTIDDKTITVDGAPQTIPGGSQTSAVETRGWSWTFGGGMEVWTSTWMAIYGDVGRVAVKGNFRDAEGLIDDRLLAITIGARIRVGGW